MRHILFFLLSICFWITQAIYAWTPLVSATRRFDKVHTYTSHYLHKLKPLLCLIMLMMCMRQIICGTSILINKVLLSCYINH